MNRSPCVFLPFILHPSSFSFQFPPPNAPADRFLITVTTVEGSLNARCRSEDQARTLIRLICRPGAVSVTLHEETKKGLKLLLEIG